MVSEEEKYIYPEACKNLSEKRRLSSIWLWR